MARHLSELGAGAVRIRLSGSGQSYRFGDDVRDAAKNPSGMHHARRLYGLCLFRVRRNTQMEQRRLVSVPDRRGRLRLLGQELRRQFFKLPEHWIRITNRRDAETRSLF